MGLIEDREMAAFQTYAYPNFQNQIQAEVGFEIPIDVAWEKLKAIGMAAMYTHNLTNVYFIPLVQALKQIAVDAIGRDALLTRLQRIVIQNETGNYDPTKFAVVENGVLLLEHAPNSNVENVNDRVQAVIKAIVTGI